MTAIRYGDLDSVIAGLTQLSEPTMLPVALSIKIGKTKRKLMDARLLRQEEMNKTVERFGQVNEDGEKQLAPFKKGWTEAAVRLKEIDDITVDVNLEIPMSVLSKEYEKKPFPGYGNIIAALLPLIVEDDVEHNASP